VFKIDHRAQSVIGKTPTLLEPYGNYVVIELLKQEDTTKGGVVLPDQVKDKEKKMLARVVAVGTGQRTGISGELIPCFSKPGDLVVLLKHAPTEVKIGDGIFHVVFEGDILGRIDQEELARLLEEEEVEEVEEPDTPVSETDEDPGAAENYGAGTVVQRESGVFVVTGS
jgi:chaperonin GroES